MRRRVLLFSVATPLLVLALASPYLSAEYDYLYNYAGQEYLDCYEMASYDSSYPHFSRSKGYLSGNSVLRDKGHKHYNG